MDYNLKNGEKIITTGSLRHCWNMLVTCSTIFHDERSVKRMIDDGIKITPEKNHESRGRELGSKIFTI